MKIRQAWISGFLIAFHGAFAAAPATAQIDTEHFADLGFNFSPPGARGAALGGAFVGLADDATAAETNPAGLTALLYPQLSFEWKQIGYERTLQDRQGGVAGGTPLSDEVGFPSFASGVMPIGPLRLGLFRYELVNFREHFTVTDDNYQGYTDLIANVESLIYMRVANLGAVLATRLGSTVSLGVSAGMSSLDFDVELNRDYEAAVEGEPVLAVDSERWVDGSGLGSEPFLNAGVMLRWGTAVSLGFAYHLRPRFDGAEWRFRGSFLGEPYEQYPMTGPVTIKIPDALAGGVAVRPTDVLTVSASAEYVQYSQRAEGMALTIVANTHGQEFGADVMNPDDFRADDGLDMHLGSELAWVVGRTPVALRAGLARFAPSNIYYVGPNPQNRELWGTEPNEHEFAWSAGIGAVLGRRVQLDAAATGRESRLEVIASAVLFLGRR